MTDEFGAIDIPVSGRPATVDEAEHLFASDPIKFEQWAVTMVRATPTGGKPVDGEIIFVDNAEMEARRCIVEVTGGRPNKKHFDAFLHHAKEADMGIYVTLHNPSSGMRAGAKEAGQYYSKGWEQKYPRVQILTIEQLFGGTKPDLPPPYKKGRGAKMPI
jgi:site-specific DNA-methyltransferase (adenine-specific)